MTESSESTDPIFEDDAPDLSQEPWAGKLARGEFKRGRPKKADPKVSTTIRLDPDVIAAFKADGAGWQTRINEALREKLGI